ncbi:HK97 family phage prohead protease [Ruegeria pomeroyi]|nr:HK97 family phage prohead protease [Ruegeria pomeroyi]
MLWGARSGGLELRQESGGDVVMTGRFPYNKSAVLTDGGKKGRPRKERIASRAFGYRINTPSDHGGKKDIHFLVGHDWDRPLASTRSGTLDITDTDEAVIFVATITVELQQANYVRDFLAGYAAGLILGLSPGFRIPPERVSPKAESVEEEDPSEGMAIIRTVHDALLYELSAVTRPAYTEAQIEARNWITNAETPALASDVRRVLNARNRWR